MPNLHKDVKAAIDAAQLGAPVHELISRSHLIKQGAEGVRTLAHTARRVELTRLE